MFELLEKAFLTGLGAVSLSQKKAEEMITEMKEKYKVSEDEGRDLLNRLQNMAKDSRSRITEIAEGEVQKAMEKLGLVPRDEFDRLKKRLDELENKLRQDDPGPEC